MFKIHVIQGTTFVTFCTEHEQLEWLYAKNKTSLEVYGLLDYNE